MCPERAPDVPQAHPERTHRRASGELRASDAIPTDPTQFRRSPFGAPGQGPGGARQGTARLGAIQVARSPSFAWPVEKGRGRAWAAGSGIRSRPDKAQRRKAGSGRSSTTSASLKRSKPSKVPQARKSRKPATPQALKPQVPQPRKSRNPPQVPQDQQPHKPPQSRNPLNPRSSRKSCKPLAKSFCAF